jgi:uncharacterized membrane protein
MVHLADQGDGRAEGGGRDDPGALAESPLPAQALIAFLTGVGIMQIALVDEPEFVLPSIVALGGIVAVLLLAGRDNALLRWLAYAAFVFQLCFVYLVMVGSMLGTAGFFVIGGLTLSVLAWLITRLERRLSGPAAPFEGGVSCTGAGFCRSRWRWTSCRSVSSPR